MDMNKNMGTIEYATEKDRAQLLALYRAQVGKEFCPWDDEYPGNETIDYDLSRNALIIMREGNEIIAAISLEEDEDVDGLEFWSPDLQPSGNMARLAVSPNEQNKGIAKIMMQFGLDELKKQGKKSVHFLVNRHNIKAIKSYSKFGYNVVGECNMFEQEFLCYEKEL